HDRRDVSGLFDRARDIRATAHVVEGKEWLVLHAGASGASLEDASLAALDRTLRQCGRSRVASPVADAPEQLPRLRREICERLQMREAELVRRVQALADAVSLLQAEAFDRLAGELLADCALRGKAAQAQAEQLFYAACGQLLASRPEKLRGFLGAPSPDLRAAGALAMRLLTPETCRLSDQVRSYLEAHYEKPLTLGAVASALGYSASYLGQVFRAETGMGFHPYLNRLRIQKAAKLLTDSALPVHEVAEAVGYGQYKRFLAHFKQYLGKTPKAYRKG
nr:helix-turn-helix domain-containing protein [Clostridia bacterium]